MMSTRCAYPTNVSEGQWEVVQRLLSSTLSIYRNLRHN
jgi:hypothetical protein